MAVKTTLPARYPQSLLQPILVGAGIVVVLTLATFLGMDLVYAGQIFPGVQFLDINLGSKTQAEAEQILAERVDGAKLLPITLEFDGLIWEIDPSGFDFEIDAQALAARAVQVGRSGHVGSMLKERLTALFNLAQPLVSDVDLVHSFDRAALTQYLENIAQSIDQPQQDAVLVIKDDRAVEFSNAQDGYKLDIDKTIVLIAQKLLSSDPTVSLPVMVDAAQVTLAATNTLGIDTRIARGVSDFSGSPSNRRHNIQTGANRFDGFIIEPGETFSFVRELGPVDASTGYLPELVIKEDETIPEFGGGLCQVSTTAFRAILDGGLPVVERHNHSYRVVYYEPAGTDATIYEPYPDLKFTNDTPGHILMDTWIDGNKLYFDFYGTDTGREAELDGPYIYNVTGYPEPIYIDTSTIPVGEVRQIDSAHRGADATLYRKVYQNGKLVGTDTFTSHYIPWPAKYLRGVEEAAEVETDLENVLPKDAASETALVDPTENPEEES